MSPDKSPAIEKRSGPGAFAMVIGGMKCGTTSVFDLLAQHPEICACRVKEPGYFAEVEDPRAEWSRYLSLWDWDPNRHAVALEASTNYAKYPWIKGVPERIAASPAESVRFIYMVRDPIQRIASQVRHGVYDGWGQSLDEGISEDLIDFSRYAMQADRYAAVFPREHILIVPLEEFKTQPDAVLERICAFLGISTTFQFQSSDEPRNVGTFYTVSPTVAQLAKNPVIKGVVDKMLPRSVKHQLRKWLAKSGASDQNAIGRWQLSPGEIEQVRELLSEDMSSLREHYGVNASWLAAAERTPHD
jgi:hypothetical protein